jgi:hypothetical protein
MENNRNMQKNKFMLSICVVLIKEKREKYEYIADTK